MTNPPGNPGDPNAEPDPFAQTQFGQPAPDLNKGQQQPPSQEPFAAPQYGQPAPGATPSYPGNPYPAGPVGNPGPAPANSMVSSIIVTVLSFLGMCATCISLIAGIFGIIAIVKANAVNGLWAAGDTVGAQRSADEAKKWSNIAWIVFGVSVALWIILLIVLAVTGNGVAYYNFES